MSCSFFEDRDDAGDEVVIKNISGKYHVYATDERASKISEEIFENESDALDDFIARLRALNKSINTDTKLSGLQYCYDEALIVIRKQYPDATEECFVGDYETAYWNDAEAYVNRKGAWEYPGTWYPGLIAYTDAQMIDYLVETGLSDLSKK